MSDGLAVYDLVVSPLAGTGSVFDVHDIIMEHGCGIGQRRGVIGNCSELRGRPGICHCERSVAISLAPGSSVGQALLP